MALWLAVLSLVVILCVRQLGLITARLGAPLSSDAGAPDGPEIGEPIPMSARRFLPDLEGVAYLFFAEAGCIACRQVAADLQSASLDARIVAVVTGSGRAADGLVSILPDATDVVRGDQADTIATEMKVEVTPVAFQVERGYVSGKAVLRDVADFAALVNAREHSDAAEVVAEAVELSRSTMRVEVQGGRH